MFVGLESERMSSLYWEKIRRRSKGLGGGLSGGWRNSLVKRLKL